ncbi:MAG: UvrB/UvrC motif-containing protein [Gemmatimonadales bacterium]|jgi:protein arginine kinase activator|nr:UvrB/UvrC motif-containing protein [Gemmatimonadales bacterium]
MRCDECGERDAVVHLTQIVNEQVTTVHLCEKCAAERGVESPAQLTKSPLGSFLAAMGKPGATVPANDASCPGCGATLADFREAGRLGCAACYDAFGAPLRDLLRRLHGSTQHVGERYVPGGSAVPAAPPTPAEGGAALRLRLQQAVRDEDFELAAQLRDQLRALG